MSRAKTPSGLTPREKAFAEAYARDPTNATAAAIAAGYSPKSARQSAHNVQRRPDVAAYISSLIDAARKAANQQGGDELIASLVEIQKFRTRVLRGEEKDAFGLDAGLADREKAAAALEKTLMIQAQQDAARQYASASGFLLPAIHVGPAFSLLNMDISPGMEIVCKGGRGSGKSTYISLKIIEIIQNNPDVHACVIRKVSNTLRDSVFATLRWAALALGLEDAYIFHRSPLEIIKKDTGQTIFFRGADDPAKLKSIKPPAGYLGILWFEELDQMAGPEEVRNIEQSVLRGGPLSWVFKSFNPPRSAQNWANLYALEAKDGKIVHCSDYRQTPAQWLGQHFIDDAEHLQNTNPSAYEHEYLGVANGTGGQVFDNLELRKINDDEISAMDRIYQGVDWGWYPDQYAFLRTYYDAARERIYLLDELYVNKAKNADTAQWIIDHGYDDYAIICDSAEPKSVNDYRDMGIQARGAIKGPGSVDYGFKWLQSRTIVIDQHRTPNAYKEITMYEYERDKDGNVVSGYPDANDHAISALRYAYEPIFIRRGSSA